MDNTTANDNTPPKRKRKPRKHKDVNPPTDIREVYVASKPLLNGYGSENFNRKSLKVAIKGTQTPALIGLLDRHGIYRVTKAAQKLLHDQVFKDTRVAQTQFPDLFETASDGTVKEGPELTEAAAQFEASPIGSSGHVQSPDTMMMMSQNHWDAESSGDSGEDTLIWTSGDQIPLSGHGAVASSSSKAESYHVFLPMKSQYDLLSYMQTLLEYACFEFAKKVIPANLEFKGWDCAEAVELNLWVLEFTKHTTFFSEKDTGELCRSMIRLRHAAVHRRRLPVEAINQFLRDAESFVELLGDVKRTAMVSKLHQDTRVALEELKKQKEALHTRLEETMKDIEAKKAILREIEAEVKADIEREGHGHEQAAGTVVDDALSGLADMPTTIERHEMVPESAQTDAIAEGVSEDIVEVHQEGVMKEDVKEERFDQVEIAKSQELYEDGGIEQATTRQIEYKGWMPGLYESSVKFVYGFFH